MLCTCTLTEFGRFSGFNALRAGGNVSISRLQIPTTNGLELHSHHYSSLLHQLTQRFSCITTTLWENMCQNRNTTLMQLLQKQSSQRSTKPSRLSQRSSHWSLHKLVGITQSHISLMNILQKVICVQSSWVTSICFTTSSPSFACSSTFMMFPPQHRIKRFKVPVRHYMRCPEKKERLLFRLLFVQPLNLSDAGVSYSMVRNWWRDNNRTNLR